MAPQLRPGGLPIATVVDGESIRAIVDTCTVGVSGLLGRRNPRLNRIDYELSAPTLDGLCDAAWLSSRLGGKLANRHLVPTESSAVERPALMNHRIVHSCHLSRVVLREARGDNLRT